jgi:putative hydrolase of the HAD superfamily
VAIVNAQRMIDPSIRCVLFDAVGTLIYAHPSVAAVYFQAAHEFGLSLDQSVIRDRFVAAFQAHFTDAHHENWTSSEAIEKDRWRAVVSEVFRETLRHEVIFDRLWEHFAKLGSWRAFDDVASCLGRLQRRALILGVASNFDARLINICRRLPELHHCKHVFCSSQLGWRKPATSFLRAIERSLNVEPQQILLVGDDLDADYQGALAAGWQAILLDRRGDANVPAICSLDELS